MSYKVHKAKILLPIPSGQGPPKFGYLSGRLNRRLRPRRHCCARPYRRRLASSLFSSPSFFQRSIVTVLDEERPALRREVARGLLYTGEAVRTRSYFLQVVSTQGVTGRELGNSEWLLAGASYRPAGCSGFGFRRGRIFGKVSRPAFGDHRSSMLAFPLCQRNRRQPNRRFRARQSMLIRGRSPP
jgi:hypothetical protein